MKAAATTPAFPPVSTEGGEKKYYTYEELVECMPETNIPHELWDGELIISPTPSFYHQEITLRFYEILARWVRTRKLGKAITAPIDMVLSPSRSVQPDVAFISNERRSIIQRVIHGPADLVVEVISEGGRQRDRIDKRDLYEQHGVKEYWIVDPEAKTVEVLSLQNQEYKLMGRWRTGETASSTLLTEFKVAVDYLFTGEESA